MRGIVSFVVIVVVIFATGHWFGPIGVTRLFGLFFIGGAVYGCFALSFSVSLGNTEVARLTGWNKLFAIVPIAVIGITIATYAAPITCISAKYKHLCV